MISKDLFLSILAMDSYNRGYGAGISDGEGAKDDGGNDLDGLGGLDSSVGGARVIAQDVSDAAQAASFYAIAYKVGPDGPADLADKTVISDRSTNTPFHDPARPILTERLAA